MTKRAPRHQFTSEEAREAGRKGGRKISKNKEHMSEIGRRGGLAKRKSNGSTETIDES